MSHQNELDLDLTSIETFNWIISFQCTRTGELLPSCIYILLEFDVKYYILEKLINIKCFVAAIDLHKKVHTSGNRAYISFNYRPPSKKCIPLEIEHTFPLTNGWSSASSSVCVHRSEGMFTKVSLEIIIVIYSICMGWYHPSQRRTNVIEWHIHVVLCLAVLSALRRNVFLVRAIRSSNRNPAFPLKHLLRLSWRKPHDHRVRKQVYVL